MNRYSARSRRSWISFFRSPFEDLVVDVGEVLNEAHVQHSPYQIATRDDPVHLAAGMAEMEEVLGPEITAINACFARTDWGNRFRAAGQGVVEA